MRTTITRLVICLGVVVAVSSPLRADDDDDEAKVTVPDAIVVYVVEDDLDVSKLEKRIGEDYDFDDADWLGSIEVRTSKTQVDAYAIELPGAGESVTAYSARSWLRKLQRVKGVRYVDVYERRKVKGQPFTIPILDGDLDLDDLKAQAAMAQVQRSGANAIATGAGVTIAVLDGGFDLGHAALNGRLTTARWDAIDFDNDPQDLGDDVDTDGDTVTDSMVGHGTFVSSLVLTGAPDAMIMPIRVLDDEGWGTDFAVAMGIQYAVANGADVINMSLVMPDIGMAAKDALEAAIAQGLTIVTAAGNAADGLLDDPYVRARSITVGAVDEYDTVVEWSANGLGVDVYAPGADVAGALGGDVANSYGWWDGTSFASAVASGAAALVIDNDPLMDIRDVRDRVVVHGHGTSGAIPSTRQCVDLLEALID